MITSNLWFHLILAFITILCTHTKESTVHPVYSKECAVWANISRSMEREPNVDLDCQQNTECSGMDCIGKYNASLMDMVHFEKDFCSGLIVEACSQPTKVQMYVVMFNPKHNNTQETEMTITNNTEIPLKGAIFNVFGNKAQCVLDVKMNHTTVNGQPHIFLEAFMKVKVHASLFGMEFEHYLNDFEVGIVRGMYIPVPHCDPHIGNHTHRSGRCNWEHISQLKRQGPMTKCDIDEIDACTTNQMCELGMCVCMPGYVYTTQFSCAREIIIDFEPYYVDGTTQSTKISQKQIIIIVCSIGGLLVLSVIISTVVIKYKRYQARYGQHGHLLQEEDDPEVPA